MKGKSDDFRRAPLPFHTTSTNTDAPTASSSSSSSTNWHRSRLSSGSAASPALTYTSGINSPSIASPRSSDARYESHFAADQYYDMSRSQENVNASTGSSLWGEGMRSFMSSIIGAPSTANTKANASSSPSQQGKGDRSDASDPYAPLPLQAHEVAAATSHWEVPRETITMTMEFQGGYDDPAFVQPMWQSQAAPGYPAHEHGGNGASGFAAPYPQQPAPSGLPGADAPRTRSNTEFPGLLESRDYGRRPLAPHSRSFNGNGSDYPALAHNGRVMGGQEPVAANGWWPEQGGQVADPASHMASHDPRGQHWSANLQQPGRRVNNAPPLPDTRNASRSGWSGMSSSSSSSSMGLEPGQYEFPQSTLGKRSHDEDPNAAAGPGPVDYSADSAYRRYSLAPNMVFSRSPVGGQSNGGGAAGMTTYRPPPGLGPDPRRPSVGEHAYPSGMLPPQSRPYPGAIGGGAGPSWSGWPSASHPSGLSANIGATPSPQSSPAASGWKDGGGMPRHAQETGPTSPSSQPTNGSTAGAAAAAATAGNSAKRHRRQSSASGGGGANTLQTNLLATTPSHITHEIVLRAPAGSKLEDVYYDQHCSILTGMPDPPPSDFDVDNVEDRPRLQTDKLRFPGDLYTPRWVRGTGNAREAWCDRCEHGNWLQLKNSQYWYDQVHKHGISSVSGLRFTAPLQLRIYANAAGTVEGKCHQCKEWVLICTAKRRRNFAAFFKHAHACHSYRKASAIGNGPIVEHNPGHKKKQLAQQQHQQML